MKRWLRRLIRIALVCFGLLLVVIAVEIAAGWRCDLQGQIPPPLPQAEQRKAVVADIRDYARPEDDAYFGFPEWYIVWSYQEKADFQEGQLPSRFPYFAAVRQYWRSYCCVARLTRGKYKFDAGEQISLVVIGTSFSAEYILKGVYENTIGRLSEWSSRHEMTDEDRYAYKVGREYADFVHVRPFYEFYFAKHVRGLWAGTSFWGPHVLRKWERKAFLSLDYAVEGMYCWVIEKGTHVTYGYEPDKTYVWIENADEAVLSTTPGAKVVKRVGTQSFILSIPRYQEFTAVASTLAQRGARFVEIAGNSQITLSVLAPQEWRYEGSDSLQVFSLPVLTQYRRQRVVLTCKVTALGQVLSGLHSSGAEVEHIYDY